MLTEQPALTEPAAPYAARPIDPQHLPIALVAQTTEGALADALRREGPVVTFPSLDELCAALEAGRACEGVVVSSWCVWDARVKEHLPNLSSVAIFGYAEGFGWPDEVRRMSGEAELRAWLDDLKAVKEPVSASSAPHTRTSLERQESTPLSPQHEPSVLEPEESSTREQHEPTTPTRDDGGDAESTSDPRPKDGFDLSGTAVAQLPDNDRAPPDAPNGWLRRRKPPTRCRGISTPDEPPAPPQELSLVEPPSKRAKRPVAKDDGPVHRTNAHAIQRTARSQITRPIAAETGERELMKLALQIGLQRARELIDQLRARAHDLFGNAGP